MVDEMNQDGAEHRSPSHRMSAQEAQAQDTLVISPASSSLGSPTQITESASSDNGVPMNPFRLDFEDDQDGRDSPLHNNAILNDDDNHSTNSNNMSRVSLSSLQSNANDEEDQPRNHTIGLQRVPSLSLSTYSGYDTDEDEDGVLKRFHDQAKSSLALNLSLDDDESVYSAVNTEEAGSRSSHGTSRKKKKRPADHIKDAIHGMRKAHQHAQRQRSTRQFLAMSEGNRSAHSFTEALCLSPWCDFSSGRGMVAMAGVFFILVTVVIALIKFEHLAGGVWTLILGVGLILVRRFWVPIHWLIWGQFVEKKRRRNMKMYNTLNGEREKAASLEIGVRNNFEEVQHHDEHEIGFRDELELNEYESRAESIPNKGELA